jgi:hypothetical protein
VLPRAQFSQLSTWQDCDTLNALSAELLSLLGIRVRLYLGRIASVPRRVEPSAVTSLPIVPLPRPQAQSAHGDHSTT